MKTFYGLASLRTVWDAVATSLWFVPLLMMCGSFLLASLTFWIDSRLDASSGGADFWWIYAARPDDAREVVTTLLSSMITMTSLVFSITMVVLTLAANQFGPRLIRNFMASSLTQVVLGTFTMMIVYCLLVLVSIGRRESDGVLPYSSVSTVMLLMGISLVLMVLFIHSLGRSIVSETVIERVGQELDEIISQLDPINSVADEDPSALLPKDFEERSAFFGPPTPGYIQAVEFERLVGIAEGSGTLIGFYFGPGDYVAAEGRGIAVYPGDRLTSDLAGAINRAVTIGIHRTPVQDVEFAIRHLVEIALRALSPGINDPYTAVAVLHRLSASFARLMEKALPVGVFRDASGAVRVLCPRPTIGGLLNSALDQIRQDGQHKPLVMIHLLEAIIRIADHVRSQAQLNALRDQLQVVIQAAERSISEPADVAVIRGRGAKADHVLQRAHRRMEASDPR
jgi:uncharacterized membrane protein